MLVCSALDVDFAVMQGFQSQKCSKRFNNLRTNSRGTKDCPDMVCFGWMDRNRQSALITPETLYSKKNQGFLLGAKWQRDLEFEREWSKSLEIWCEEGIKPGKKKFWVSGIELRKMCNDFRAHEPRNIEFHQQNRRTFAKIEFGDLKTFFYLVFIVKWLRYAGIWMAMPRVWDLAVTLLRGELWKFAIRMVEFYVFRWIVGRKIVPSHSGDSL